MKLPLGLPPEIGPILQAGAAFAGTPDGFRAYLDDQIKTTGATYFISDVAFGDVTPQESMRTIDLMAKHVMPHYPDKGRVH
jgi:hypothetical protein